MITTPKTYCPLCGRNLNVIRTEKVTRYADQITYLCMCPCGDADMVVQRGKILSVSLRDPEKRADFRILAGNDIA